MLSTGPWGGAFAFAMLVAYLSDLLAHRFTFAIIPTFVAIAGFVILLIPDLSSSVYYGSLFLAVSGTYTAMPVVICWYNTNLGGHHKRSVGSAWQIGFGNIGGIVATYVFLPETAPRFVLGKSMCIGFMVLCILSTTFYFAGCAWENRKRARGEGKNTGMSEEAMTRLGDAHPDFRYIL
jgi:hypothetical protein